jgi:hypothetical protein
MPDCIETLRYGKVGYADRQSSTCTYQKKSTVLIRSMFPCERFLEKPLVKTFFASQKFIESFWDDVNSEQTVVNAQHSMEKQIPNNFFCRATV